MAARTPQLFVARPEDDVLAAVLATVQGAPLVPLTDEEEGLLAEVEHQPASWLSSEDFLSTMKPLDDAE